MLLAIDIGNTNIVAAVMQGSDRITFTGRIETVKTDTAPSLQEKLGVLLKEGGVDTGKITGAALCSVVPEITDAAKTAVQSLVNIECLVVKHTLKLGICVDVDEPAVLGSDLLTAAVGARREYEGTVAVFDLGTATTLTVITGDGHFIGGLIMPGANVAKDAMVSRASQLPAFTLDGDVRLIGKDTIESMRSGIVIGNAAMMDALVKRLKGELGQEVTAIVTGGLGRLVARHCESGMIYEPDLVLKGLWYIYEMNRQ